MKKTAAIILISALAASLFSCSGKSGTQNSNTETVAGNGGSSVSSEKEDGSKDEEDPFKEEDIIGEELPAEYKEVPSDWKELSEYGLHILAPPDVHAKADMEHVYTDKDTDEDSVRICFVEGTDWSKKRLSENTPLYAPKLKECFEKIGIDSYNETRLSLYRNMLTIDSNTKGKKEAMEYLMKAKQLIFPGYTGALMTENNGTPVFIHEYQGYDNYYWVNAMADEQREICLMVSCPDKDTALKIAGSVYIVPSEVKPIEE